MNKFLIPLKQRGESASSQDNFLWRDGNVFVMDNHRLALWCWFQAMKKGQRYNLFHIDAHPDMSESALPYFFHDLWSMSLDDYRTAWQADINMPLFRWDNYIEIFLRKYPGQVGHTISATHHLGSDKVLAEDVKPYDLVKRMNEIFGEEKYVNELPWVVNLDLDYFFSAAPEKVEIFGGEFVSVLAGALKKGMDNGMVEVLTVSLSPECCGSWGKAEGFLKKVANKLELSILSEYDFLK